MSSGERDSKNIGSPYLLCYASVSCNISTLTGFSHQRYKAMVYNVLNSCRPTSSMIIPWVGLKNEPKYDSLRQSSVDNIILSWSILRNKNFIGVHTTSPSNITFSPLITNIPRGISPYCFPTCIRSTVLCSTKFATASKTMSCLVCHFELGHQNQGNLWRARLSWSPFHGTEIVFR